MKYLRISGLCLLLTITNTWGYSQQGSSASQVETIKPNLFDSYPDKIPVDVPELQNLLAGVAAKGSPVSIHFLNKSLPGFEGQIVSRASKFNNTLRSVVIRSSKFNGATLTLSSSTTTDGAATFSGRIISFQHADMYVLQKENDNYYLIKKRFNEVVNE
jgi:hypothetical protein